MGKELSESICNKVMCFLLSGTFILGSISFSGAYEASEKPKRSGISSLIADNPGTFATIFGSVVFLGISGVGTLSAITASAHREVAILKDQLKSLTGGKEEENGRRPSEAGALSPIVKDNEVLPKLSPEDEEIYIKGLYEKFENGFYRTGKLYGVASSIRGLKHEICKLYYDFKSGTIENEKSLKKRISGLMDDRKPAEVKGQYVLNECEAEWVYNWVTTGDWRGDTWEMWFNMRCRKEDAPPFVLNDEENAPSEE